MAKLKYFCPPIWNNKTEGDLNHSIVRVLSSVDSEQPIGAGFVVTAQHVLTCAHVIIDALNLPKEIIEIPNGVVLLDFPLLQHERVSARIVRWYPPLDNPNGNIEDIAVLELLDDIPPRAQPTQLTDLVQYHNHRVRLCGFPRGMNNGFFIGATTIGLDGRSYIQLNTDPQQGQVAPGFSGTAVWSDQKNSVVGMIVRIDRQEQVVPAFAIPASTLMTVLGELGIADTFPLNSVEIVSPKAGEGVSAQGIVKGNSKLKDDSQIWILVHLKLLVEQWWPQNKPLVKADGTWEALVYFGETQDIGLEFEIAVATFQKEAEQEILRYHERGKETGKYLPIRFPKTTSNVDIVTVKKISHY